MRRWKALVAVGALLIGFGPTLAADDSDSTQFKWNWFGSLRARPEYNDNLNDLNSGYDDEISYANYRINFGFSVDLDKDISVVLDAQSYGVWGENQSPSLGSVTYSNNSSDLGMYRAYIEARNIFGHPFAVRAGRQPLSFADEWLLGDADFYAGTAWDGVRGDWTVPNERGTVTAFWANGGGVNRPENVPDPSGEFYLYGVWTSWNTSENTSLDLAGLYWIDRRNYYGKGYNDKRYTYTANFSYLPDDGFDFVGNAAYQGGGTVDTSSYYYNKVRIDAYALELTPGWVWDNDGRKTKVWGRFAYYTGDDPDTSNNETFNPLTQDQHDRYGKLDFWGGQWGHMAYEGGTSGLEVYQIGFSTETKAGISLKGIVETLRRTEKFGSGQDNRNLGQEVGVSAGYNYGKNLSLELGVGQLFAGTAFTYEAPFFSQANARRAWLSATARF